MGERQGHKRPDLLIIFIGGKSWLSFGGLRLKTIRPAIHSGFSPHLH